MDATRNLPRNDRTILPQIRRTPRKTKTTRTTSSSNLPTMPSHHPMPRIRQKKPRIRSMGRRRRSRPPPSRLHTLRPHTQNETTKAEGRKSATKQHNDTDPHNYQDTHIPIEGKKEHWGEETNSSTTVSLDKSIQKLGATKILHMAPHAENPDPESWRGYRPLSRSFV